MVQTGAKIQLGGLNEGLLINEYHGSLKPAVTKPPTNDEEYAQMAKYGPGKVDSKSGALLFKKPDILKQRGVFA